MYTVKLAGAVYVVHVFQKKSTRGIAAPKHELAVIRERWRRAKVHCAAHYAAHYAAHAAHYAALRGSGGK